MRQSPVHAPPPVQRSGVAQARTGRGGAARSTALLLTWWTALMALAALHPATAFAQPAAPSPDEPVHAHRVAAGDTVIGLGRRLLLDPRRWPEVARLNGLANPNRIRPGQVLVVPLALMASEPLPASVISVSGSTSLQAGQTGQAVPEGGQVRTGADGHVTLRLVDGSVLRLRPGSLLDLRESRRVPAAGAVRSGATLRRGRVEVEAEPAAAGKPGFRIDTPQGVLAVRGTAFRVAVGGGDAGTGDSASTDADALTRGEILHGAVAVAGRGAAAAAPATARTVTGGFGTTVDASGQVAPPVPLLPAPDVAALPPLQERLLVRFALPPLPGAVAWRAQVARDSRFDAVVADSTSASPELRFADLPDGDYVLRVRGIDARGLEGRDADWRFTLKARPEAPLPSAPASGASVVAAAVGSGVGVGAQVDFAWTANADAQHYRLQLASDAAFTRLVRDIASLRGTTAQVDGLPPGSYWWRLASVRDTAGGGSDRGPWGDARRLEIKPPPPSPPAARPPRVGTDTVSFDWDARPGQRVEIQIARDAAFNDRVFERTLGGAQDGAQGDMQGSAQDRGGIDWTPTGSGRFRVRLRAIDADGYIGPWSTPQTFDLPACVRDGQGVCVRGGDATLELERN